MRSFYRLQLVDVRHPHKYSFHSYTSKQKVTVIYLFSDSLKNFNFERLLAGHFFWTHTHTLKPETCPEGGKPPFDCINPKESFGSSADLITCNSALGRLPSRGWQMAEEFLAWMQGRQIRSDVVPRS